MTEFFIDPLGHFKGVDPQRLVEALGLLPGFIAGSDPEDDAKTAFDKAYCCGLFEMSGGTVTGKGIYQFPEDPDMYPIAQLLRGDETVYFYQSAIVAICDNNNPDNVFVTRID